VIPPLPRGLSGRQLMRLAEQLGYRYDRSSGSHVIYVLQRNGLHHICIPDHKEISLGTLNDLLNDMARQLGLSKAELIAKLFEKS
jgi:predicted RNA binding protein YcfA (HicA-like mRNA interferase family)